MPSDFGEDSKSLLLLFVDGVLLFRRRSFPRPERASEAHDSLDFIPATPRCRTLRRSSSTVRRARGSNDAGLTCNRKCRFCIGKCRFCIIDRGDLQIVARLVRDAVG